MATITIPRDVIVDVLLDAGLDEDALRANYSGRGMYGDECFGLVCDNGELLNFAVELGARYERGEIDDPDWISYVSMDAMGMGTIWYWPRVQVA